MATSNNSSVTLIARGNIRPNTIAIGGGKGGVSNYELLTHKPSINGHELIGNKTNADLGIPTDTQDLTNTAGFITNLVNDLVNYYTKLEIDDIITEIKQSSFRIVDDLPLVGDPGVIYLILNATPQSRNYYDEYIYTDNRWEKIGTTEIDLSGYVTDEELTQVLRNYITNTTLNETLRNYYNKADIGEMMAGKADVSSLAPVATSGSYDDLTDKPDIPNDLADLNEDSTHRIVTDAEKATWNNKSDFSGSYNDLTDKPTIPDELADLTDDATHRLVTDMEKQIWNDKSDFSGSYDDLTDKPDIPTVHNSTVTIQKNNQNIDSFTLNQSSNKSINIDVPEKTSDIQNDSGFITNTVNNLANYYLKSETYTKTEVSNLINAAVSGRFQKVNALPAQGEANVIYLVPKATVLVDNIYDEYIWEDDSWELIGDTQIDLSGYVTDDDLTAALQNYVTSATFNTTISNYYTKTEVGNLLANKVDKVDGKGLSTYDYDAAAKGVVDGVPAALNNKVDKVDGKGLSTNDYTTTDKDKLAGIAANATKVESSETNGNIKIDSVETQVYDDSELQGIIDTDTTTATGNPLNFSTKSAQNAVNTDIVIDPVQDLHGYDKPWVGGAGKNLLPITLSNLKALNTSGTWSGNVYTLNNVIFTVLTDNDNNVIGIKIGGSSASANTNFYIVESFGSGLSASIITGCPANGGSSNYRMFWDNNETDTGTGATVDSPTNGNVRIQIISGYTPNNLIFYPMIRLASVSDATFEPYSNIASISGYDEVDINGCGENLFNPNAFVQGLLDDSTGELVTTGIGIRWISSDFIKASESVGLSGYKDGTEDNWCVRFCEYDEHKNFIKNTININIQSVTSYARSIVLNSNTKYIRASFGFADKTTTVSAFFATNRLKLELGSQATPYTPYTESNNISIQLGDTVYGGKLDVEKGELVVDRAFIEFDGSNDEGWTLEGDGDRRVYTTILSSIIKPNSSATIIPNIISDRFEAKTPTDIYNRKIGITVGPKSTSNVIYVNNTGTTMVLATWLSWLENNNLHVVYELATPTTIQLSPHAINLLKGVNTITTNGTSITLNYRNGEMATLEDVLNAENKLQEDFNFKFDNIDSQIDDLYWTFGKVEYTTLSRHSYEQGDYLVWTLDPDLFFIVLQPIAIGDALIEGVNIDYAQIGYILKWLENRVSSLLTIMTPPTGLGDYNLVAHRTLGGNVQYEWQMIPSDFDYSHIVTKAGTGVYKTSALDTGSGETIVYISTSNVTRFSICNNIAVGDAPTWGNSGLWLIPVPADANQIRIQLAPGSMLYPVMCSLYHFSQDPATTIKYRYWPDYSPAWYTQSVFTWDMDVIRAECGDVQYYWVAEVCKSGYGNIQPSEVATYMPAITYIKNST